MFNHRAEPSQIRSKSVNESIPVEQLIRSALSNRYLKLEDLNQHWLYCKSALYNRIPALTLTTNELSLLSNSISVEELLLIYTLHLKLDYQVPFKINHCDFNNKIIEIINYILDPLDVAALKKIQQSLNAKKISAIDAFSIAFFQRATLPQFGEYVTQIRYQFLYEHLDYLINLSFEFITDVLFKTEEVIEEGNIFIKNNTHIKPHSLLNWATTFAMLPEQLSKPESSQSNNVIEDTAPKYY